MNGSNCSILFNRNHFINSSLSLYNCLLPSRYHVLLICIRFAIFSGSFILDNILAINSAGICGGSAYSMLSLTSIRSPASKGSLLSSRYLMALTRYVNALVIAGPVFWYIYANIFAFIYLYIILF